MPVEYCSTVWHSGLSESNCKDIERGQKAAMKVIKGKRYEGYEEALKFMKLNSLKERREKMALKFAKKVFETGWLIKVWRLSEKRSPKIVCVGW